MTNCKKYDIIILGAGAAGLMCAATAGKKGLSILVIEQHNKAGGKISISGGGKCNFTNMDCSHDNFICSNPHFVKSALARFSQWDFISLLDDHDIHWEERDHGRLFCCHSAGEIVTMLQDMCRDEKIEFAYNSSIKDLCHKEDTYYIATENGTFCSPKLVVALGSVAWPQCGAQPTGYDIASHFDINIIPTKAALVPLMYRKQDSDILCELTGNSINARVSCNGQSFSEEILFTHHGLSGPAILQISNYWNTGESITIDWLNGMPVSDLIEQYRQTDGGATFSKILHQKLPLKFIRIWQANYLPDGPVASLTKLQIEQAQKALNSWEFIPSASAGLKKAEAALGGVDTDAISSKTMECKQQKGLYFIGEVLDVTGQLGGYNLQWAWSSGYCCGKEL